MSESADREDRTEAPSPKRLREARERGDVPRSRELANVAVLGATAVAILASSGYMARTSLGWMRGALSFDPTLIGHADRLPKYAALLVAGAALPVLPLLTVALLACFIAPLAMGGIVFSNQALQPN